MGRIIPKLCLRKQLYQRINLLTKANRVLQIQPTVLLSNLSFSPMAKNCCTLPSLSLILLFIFHSFISLIPLFKLFFSQTGAILAKLDKKEQKGNWSFSCMETSYNISGYIYKLQVRAKTFSTGHSHNWKRLTRDIGEFNLGDTQTPTRHSPDQPAVATLIWAGVGLGDVQISLPNKIILWLYIPGSLCFSLKAALQPCGNTKYLNGDVALQRMPHRDLGRR